MLMPVCHKQNDKIVMDSFFKRFIICLIFFFYYFACMFSACGGQKVLKPVELEVGILVYGDAWA